MEASFIWNLLNQRLPQHDWLLQFYLYICYDEYVKFIILQIGFYFPWAAGCQKAGGQDEGQLLDLGHEAEEPEDRLQHQDNKKIEDLIECNDTD